jgi:hypothetical protein
MMDSWADDTGNSRRVVKQAEGDKYVTFLMDNAA